MRGEKEPGSQVQLRSLGCSGGPEHEWRGFLSCCKTHNKAYCIQGWNNNGQEPPFDRKSIYPPDMAHLAVTEERTSLRATLKNTSTVYVYSDPSL